MSKIPSDLKYTTSHEWVRLEDNDQATVGVTDYAQAQLGELVFVELPQLHAVYASGEEIAVVESVKTAADVYAPLSGDVIEVNEALAKNPSLVNEDPYGEGWLFRLQLPAGEDLGNLMDADEYEVTCE